MHSREWHLHCQKCELHTNELTFSFLPNRQITRNTFVARQKILFVATSKKRRHLFKQVFFCFSLVGFRSRAVIRRVNAEHYCTIHNWTVLQFSLQMVLQLYANLSAKL